MIRIITDSAADITRTQAALMDVYTVALDVSFGDDPYDATSDETFETFYSMLAKCRALPTTSQPSPEGFLVLYNEAKAAGDDVIVITISSKISGTYQSACLAREMAEYSRIFVIDSLSAIMGQRMLVDLAVTMRAKGSGAEEIVDAIKDAMGRIVIMAGLDTLKYLEKGGRIPKSARMLGTMLGVKPLVELVGGKIIMAGKARGRAASFSALLALANKKSDFDTSFPICFGYTGDDTLCKAFRAQFIDMFPVKEFYTYPIGPVVGTHVGPGAFAVSYLRNAKNS